MATLGAFGYDKTILVVDQLPTTNRVSEMVVYCQPSSSDNGNGGLFWRWVASISRWFNTEIRQMPMVLGPAAVCSNAVTAPNGGVQVHLGLLGPDFDCYVYNSSHYVQVSTTNNSVAYWSMTFDRGDNIALDTITTASATVNVPTLYKLNVNSIIPKSTQTRFVTKSVNTTATQPGIFYAFSSVMSYSLLAN